MIFKSNLSAAITAHIQVSKTLISIGITSSTMVGYLIFFPCVDRIFWFTALSSLLLCSGSGALNNYKDRHIDALFKRTSNRPLPAGAVSERGVLVQASVLIFSGLTGFSLTRNSLSTQVLALVGIIFYNGIYTPLKSRTHLSIVPGAVCGMIPPLMGWSAAGGKIGKAAPEELFYIPGDLLYIMVLIGVWQLPHFWLILLNHASDYEQSHTRETLPSMLGVFSRAQLRQIMLVWILGYSVMLVMVPLFCSGLRRAAQWLVIFNGVALFILFLRFHAYGSRRRYGLEFMIVNFSMVVFILIMIVDLLIN